jgi:hypothetical protein
LSRLIAAGLLASGGCTADEDLGGRSQIGDTLVVHSERPAVTDTLELVESRRYGRASGSSEYLFSDIYSFAVGPTGDVFIHDDGGGIRQFDVEGGFVRHVTHDGEGPAEVSYVVGMAISGDGRLAAYDLGNGRIAVFEPDSSVWSVRKPDGQPRYRSRTVLFLDDGSLRVGVTPPLPQTDVITHPRPTFVRVGEDGSFVDTVYTPADAAEDCPALSEAEHRSGFWEDAREPFVPKVTWSLGSDGTFAVGCPSEYRFDLHRPEGAVLRIGRAWSPLLMPDEQRDFFERFVGVRPPPERPAYASIVLPGDGRTWVFPSQPARPLEVPPEITEQTGITRAWQLAFNGSFDVFDADGSWRAVVRLPREARYSGFPTEPEVVIRGDTVWAVALDSLDIQYVVRYQVRGLDDEYAEVNRDSHDF